MSLALTQTTQSKLRNNLFEHSFDVASPYQHCLFPLLASLGWLGNARQITESFPHYIEKIDYAAFIDIMAALHFHVERVNITGQKLDARLYPCLYVGADDHIMVLLEINDETQKIRVFDGQSNDEQWVDAHSLNGACLVFSKMSDDEKKLSDGKNWVLSLLKENKVILIQALILSCFMNLMVTLIPLFVMTIYDRVITTGSTHLLAHLVAGAVITFIGIFVFSQLRAKLFSTLAARLDNRVGSKIFRHIINLPSKNIENASVGTQVSRIKEFESLREFCTSSSVGLLFDFPFVLLYLAVIGMLAGNLVLVPLTIFAFYYGLTMMLKKITHRNVEATARTNAKRQEFMLETFHHLKEIKCANAVDTWKTRYQELSSNAALSNYYSTVLINVTQSVADAFMIVTGAAVLVFGIEKVISHEITIGIFIAVMMLIWRLLGPVNTFFAMLPRLDQLWSSTRQMNQLMMIESENAPATSHVEAEFKGRIAFKNISLRFESYLAPALLGVSFEIKPGELVIVSGGNGSGKSTLIKCLLRIYQPQSGSVSVDGKDVRQIQTQDLRHGVAYVPQVTHFFYGTINQNLRMANPLASDESIFKATQDVGLYDEIMAMPDGFETRLRDGSENNLSGNFKQRLSIARALIKPCNILLFDEPFDGMSDTTEAVFLSKLMALRGKKTIVMVVHQSKYFKYADRIIYMTAGQIAFNGTPQEGLKILQRMKQ